MTARRPTVHVIIVNFKTARMCVECLRSLVSEREAAPGLSASVVDVASGDGSVELLRETLEREGWQGWVELVAHGANVGFAGGNNLALAPALARAEPPDYIHLLNPDTYVRPGAVLKLVEQLERNPGVGLAGSRLEDPDGTPQRSAFRFPTLAGELENAAQLGIVSWLLRPWQVAPPVPTGPVLTDWLSGASLMVRRHVFEDVGLLDEGYFLYFEETDLCLRARRAGWRCAYVPASRVVHLVAQSTGITGEVEVEAEPRPSYWFDSRRRYFEKNHGRVYAAAADLVALLGGASAEARRRALGRPSKNPPRFLEGLVRHSVLFGRS